METFLSSWIADSPDETIKELATETLFAIAVQRGQLRHLLSFVSLQLSTGVSCSGLALYSAINTIQANANSSNQQSAKSEVLRAIEAQMLNLVATKPKLTADQSAVTILSSIAAASCNDGGTNGGPSFAEEVFCWGSNSSQQLTDATPEDKLLYPRNLSVYGKVMSMTAGQYCTFAVLSNGTVMANGKGSYGRLGNGASASSSSPILIEFPAPIRKIFTSKGSDGHSIAIGKNGQIWTWGDGDYGKLGHGDSTTQKSPKLIEALSSRVIVDADCGHRHSAAVDDAGHLYVWGEGDYGRLGLGDALQRSVPVQVPDIREASQVVCGFNHTVVLSTDGRTVWSFGAAENGKLGHGDTNRQFRPKIIDALQGLTITQIAAGTQISAAVTREGALYVWGFGPCLGNGSSDETFLLPKVVRGLSGRVVIDIAVGENHVVALTKDGLVFTWGNNQNGQCGTGSGMATYTSPQMVQGLHGAGIQQVTAGTTHTFVWSAAPSEEHLQTKQKPFKLDLHEKTFSSIRELLEKYEPGEEPQAPFTELKEQEKAYLQVLMLLRNHLHVAKSFHHSGENPLGAEATALRQLLFTSLDKDYNNNPDVAKTIEQCVTIGAELLMPDMAGRIEVLLTLLPTNLDELSKMSHGKKTQLIIILASLESSDGMPLLLNFSDEKLPVVETTRKFFTSLLLAWEKLDELRNITHSLLKTCILHLAARINDQVQIFLRIFCFSNNWRLEQMGEEIWL